MADYPGRIISGGAIICAQSNSISRILRGGILGYTARFSSAGYQLIPSFTIYGLSRGRGNVIFFSIPNVLSLARIYFNNGFSQDSQNIYLSKLALGLPSGLSLSLEAFFVALLLQWLNRKQGTEQKIEVLLVGNGDKDGGYIYFTIQVSFKKNISITSDFELIPVGSITPLDF